MTPSNPEKLLIINNDNKVCKSLQELLNKPIASRYSLDMIDYDQIDDQLGTTDDYLTVVLAFDLNQVNIIPELRHLCRLFPQLPVIVVYNNCERNVIYDLIGIGVQECLELSGLDLDIFLSALDSAVARKHREKYITNQVTCLKSYNAEMEGIIEVALHNLRGPLLTMQGFTQELGNYHHKLIGEVDTASLPQEFCRLWNDVFCSQFPQYFNQVMSDIADMQKFLDNLQELNRLGFATLEMQKLDMNNLLGQVLALIPENLRRENVEISMKQLPQCTGDSRYLNLVFYSLIDNALKNLDRIRPGKVCISGQKNGDNCIYIIQDNGIGIADYNQDVIFAFCHRINPQNYPGDGVGLTIARRIINRHHGHIHVESKPGIGTTVNVGLPYDRKPLDDVL